MSVFLGIPTHDGRVGNHTVNAIFTAGRGLSKFKIDIESEFILCMNRLWCEALNQRKEGITHICYLHSDIEITTPDWLDRMMYLSEINNADVLSATVAIKDNSGMTSTGLFKANETSVLGFDHRRLSVKETIERGPTFTDEHLLLNTGLMLVDLRKEWVENICFKFQDWIYKDGSDLFQPATIAEDWGFSIAAHKKGASLWATTEIKTIHKGNGAWPNWVLR
jgi:hypothetical protein